MRPRARQNFQGTFVVSGGGNVASARMAHFCEGPNQYERIESLDGQARNVYRYNDVVHTVWPANQVAMIEQRGLLNSFPALLQAGDDGIADWYDVQPQGGERVAGHDADVLPCKPNDAYRYGYRLWADRASGLLLRADVIGERGRGARDLGLLRRRHRRPAATRQRAAADEAGSTAIASCGRC